MDLNVEVVLSGSFRRIERALPIRSSFSSMASWVSMTAVTVECDEKSAGDRAATGRTLSCRAKRGRTMSAVPQAPFSNSARKGAPQLFGQNVERQTRVLRTG